MAHLIRKGTWTPDTCRRFIATAETALPPDEPAWMVPLAVWCLHREALRARSHPLGVLLSPDDDPGLLFKTLFKTLSETRSEAPFADTPMCEATRIAFVGIDFPVYTDGRGYSLAQLLRTRHGWRGELRALGDVPVDTIAYLAGCGFDSFVLKQEHDPRLALAMISGGGAGEPRRACSPS